MTVQYSFDILTGDGHTIQGCKVSREDARKQLRTYERSAKAKGHTMAGEGTDWVTISDGTGSTYSAVISAHVPEVSK